MPKFKTFVEFLEGRISQGDTYIDPDGSGMSQGAFRPRPSRTPATVVTRPPVIKKSVLGSEYDARVVDDDDEITFDTAPQAKRLPTPPAKKKPRIEFDD